MRKRYLLGTVAAMALLPLMMSNSALGDEDEYRERGEREGWLGRFFSEGEPHGERSITSAAANPLYRNECGSCHLAYPPGLLPARSWEKLMGGLEDHFGDNAELATADQAKILDYLRANSADNSGYRRSHKSLTTEPAQAVPLRITDTLYFRREHDEIPNRHVAGNPKVRSFSNCAACHRDAERGQFDEHRVQIPGVGRWED